MTTPVTDNRRYLDINAVIGRLSAPLFGSWLSLTELLAEMDRFGIRGSVVAHSFGRELDAMTGNQALVHEMSLVDDEDRDRLVAVATLFPPHGNVDPSIEQQLEAFPIALPLAARVHPNPTHDVMDEAVHARHFPLIAEAIGNICETLSARRIPLLLEMQQVRWEEVYAICRDHARLNVVILNMGYTHKRSLFVGLDRYPNLHFDISGYHVQEGLEEIVEVFGPTRLLFGSRLPEYTPVSAISMIEYADLREEDKALIRGGNATRLLGGGPLA